MMIAILGKGRFELQDLIDFGGRSIYRDSYENTEYNRICSSHMDTTMKNFLIKMGGIFASFTLCLIGPLHAYFVHGIKSTTTEIRLPFCEPKSDAEFLANLFLQTVIATHGIFGYVVIEVFLTLFENVVTIAPRLVKRELTQAIQLYEEKSISELELHRRIRRIVELSQTADK